MRLQLRHIIFLLLATQTPFVQAQTDQKEDTEIDFLFSYYQQDGDSSAVTGGAGTEELEDFSSIIVVNVPLKNHKRLKLEQGVSYYTSASSDNIDPNTISSASYENYIGHLNWSLISSDTGKHITTAPNIRFTIQNNFLSFGFGYSWSKFSADNNRGIKITGSYSYDLWAFHYKLSKLYPREIRFFTKPLPTDIRQTIDFSINYTQVINRKMQAMLGSGIIYQWGLLSTPFHRVYFREEDVADLERLPARRYRMPVVGRWNYYANDYLILRTFYRFYFDNFGIHAHTINLETPVKFTNFFSVYPYYRFHSQSESKYFAPYKMHDSSSVYYTSDYDLSSFDSHMIGGELRFSPPLGIMAGTEARSSFIFREFEVRYGKYWRSNGLEATILSFSLSFLH